MKHVLWACLSFLLIAAAACDRDRSDERSDGTSSVSGLPAGLTSAAESEYDFEQPGRAVELDDDLEEISGLTFLSDGRLGAVQDENGILFLLDRDSGDIVERRSFGEDGDYEGIEQAGDRTFVLRSDGTIIEVLGWGDDALETRIIETVLSEKNDTEGLAYDAARNRLLIACKERPGAGLGKQQKAIYALDLAGGALHPEPAFTIDTEEIERQSGENGEFKPSALAIHPSNGALYVLSSTTRMLAVLDERGSLQQVIGLPHELFPQPEGLAFLSDGTLYISSEGDGGSGMLYSFSPVPGDG